MAAGSSLAAHQFVTQFSPEEIDCILQDLDGVELIYLDIDRYKVPSENTESVEKISVGTQTVEHVLRIYKNIEEFRAYMDMSPPTRIKLFFI